MIIGNQSPSISGKVVKVVDAGPHRSEAHLRNSARSSFFDNQAIGKKIKQKEGQCKCVQNKITC
jgi:hypothetical protein